VLPESRTLEQCFKIFAICHTTIDNLQQIKQITTEMIMDYASENVKYLEIRTTPKAYTGTTKRDYVEAVLTAIEECKSSGLDIIVKLLLSINRAYSISDAEDTIKIASEYIGKGVVGIDFSGNPNIGQFKSFISIFKMARDTYKLPVSIHYAEISDFEDSMEILLFGPERIGHGCYLNETLVEKMKHCRIPLEICLTSNVMTTQLTSYIEHHFKDFFEWGYPISLGADDRGVFSIDLSHEYWKAATEFNLNKTQLFSLAYNAIDHSFASPDEKQKLKSLFRKSTAAKEIDENQINW